MPKEIFVLSLGGSLIVPDDIDQRFLKDFVKVIESEVKKGKRFIIITGGGWTCRKYQQAARGINSKLSNIDSDWIGIKSTQLNAVLLSKIFKQKNSLVKDFNPLRRDKNNSAIIISAGFKPGSSSDHDAVLLAKNYRAKTVINLSNIDYVYDKDPKLSGAKKIEKISWRVFRKIVGNRWLPGANTPFDATASKFAEKNNLRVVVLNGRNIKNLSAALNGKKFKGTLIEK